MSTIPRSAGIYRIDGPNDKVYIGSSGDLAHRWRAHRSELNRGIHNCSHMQNAWRKYGESAFTYTVIEIVENVNNLLKREQAWLDDLFASHKRGKIYNSSRRAESRRGTKASKETLRKMSAVGKRQWEEKTDTEKAQVIATFAALREKAQRRSAEVRSIRNLNKGYQKKLFHGNAGKTHSPALLEAQSRAHRKGKIYTMIAPDGTVYEDIPSLSSFAREHGMNIATVHNILHGKCKNRAGWRGHIAYAA